MLGKNLIDGIERKAGRMRERQGGHFGSGGGGYGYGRGFPVACMIHVGGK